MSKPSKHPELVLGPLPVEMINRILGTELDAGTVILSRGSQVHANKQHPEDYPIALPHLGAIVTRPLYVGQDFRNPGKFELVGRLPSGQGFLLVALVMQLDAAGHYRVASFYRIKDSKIERRREKGVLKVAIWL